MHHSLSPPLPSVSPSPLLKRKQNYSVPTPLPAFPALLFPLQTVFREPLRRRSAAGGNGEGGGGGGGGGVDGRSERQVNQSSERAGRRAGE